MFDFDDLAEDLGGPNQASLQIEAKAQADSKGRGALRQLLREAPGPERGRAVGGRGPSAAGRQFAAAEDESDDEDRVSEPDEPKLGALPDWQALQEADQARRPAGPRSEAGAGRAQTATPAVPGARPALARPAPAAAQSAGPRVAAARGSGAAAGNAQPVSARPAESPLARAAREGGVQRVMALLQQGAEPNAVDASGETPLFRAAASGAVDAVAALLHNSADPRRRSASGRVASDLAADGATKALLELFAGAPVAPEAAQAAMAAVGGLYRPFVMQRVQDAMAKRQAPPPAAPAAEVAGGEAEPRQPWKRAVQERRRAELEAQRAAREEKAHERGPAIPLQRHAPASIQPEEEPPLFVALRRGGARQIRLLLQGRADPNMQDGMGETPLFEAVARGDADAAAALLLHGAEPLRASRAGAQPRDVATSGATRGLLDFFAGAELTSEQHEFLVESLEGPQRDAFADLVRQREATFRGLLDVGQEAPPAPDIAYAAARAGDTSNLCQAPLFRAVREGDLAQVWGLLAEGADPNAADELGETPLFEAAATGMADLTAALLLCRADPARRSMTGGVAGDLAGDEASKALLEFFMGQDVDADRMRVMVEALRDPSAREQVGQRARSHSMQEALQHTVRRLRG